MGVPEQWRVARLSKRAALRRAVKAVEAVPQANKGATVLIRKEDAVRAIARLERNGLAWGSIHDETGPEPRSLE